MRPADAAIDDMKQLNFPVRNDLSPIDPWHTCGTAKEWSGSDRKERKMPNVFSQGAWHRDFENYDTAKAALPAFCYAGLWAICRVGDYGPY
jgi:hypothetical protein